jgi:hypothetical protein
MAKRANRGRGGKKNSKLLVKEASVVMDDVACSLNYDVKLSEEEVSCESMECRDVISELDA